MPTKELSNNRTASILLLAAYVAVESFFLNMIALYVVGRFWLSNVVLHVLSVGAAYLVTDVIVRRVAGGRRKKIIVAGVVLIATILVALATSVIVLYLNKLNFQAIYN